MRTFKLAAVVAGVLVGVLSSSVALANNCPTNWQKLRNTLKTAVAQNTPPATNQFWAVLVNRTGVVCAVAFSGSNLTSQWLLSRQIAAAKAFTSNGLSTIPPGLTTDVLDGLVQPAPSGLPVGQGLYGLAAGNPLDPAKIYEGPQSRWGKQNDPMVGEIVGGTITFGGGAPIIQNGSITGAVGVSGDSAANDQLVANSIASLL